MYSLLFIALIIILLLCHRQTEEFCETQDVVGTYKNIQANQSVAVNNDFIFVINKTSIVKHNKASGELIKTFSTIGHERMKQLNNGIVLGRLLYVCNYYDGNNTIEVLDLDLEHKYYIEVKGNSGELKAIDYFQGRWWALFGHDGDKTSQTIIAELYGPYGPAKIQASEQRQKNIFFNRVKGAPARWNIRNRWHFPTDVYKHISPRTFAGFSFGPDHLVYVAGYGSEVIYVLEMDYHMNVLMLQKMIETELNGGGVVWDRKNEVMYGVNKERGEVVVTKSTTYECM